MPRHAVSLQITRRRKAHLEANPDAKIISLGIGDTTEPIPPFIVEAMKAAAEGLGTLEGYRGCVGRPAEAGRGVRSGGRGCWGGDEREAAAEARV